MKSRASGWRPRHPHNPAFSAKVALSALREDSTMAQLCEQFELRPNQVSEWKTLLLERAAEVFDRRGAPNPVNLAPLQAKIGQLALEDDFFECGLAKAGLLSANP